MGCVRRRFWLLKTINYMGKFAISIEEQLKKLESRGLNLGCYELAKQKEILLDIGYYRFGYYCHPLIN